VTSSLCRILACAAVAAAFAAPADAVNLAPNGLGQVLIYPYYTVSAHQQTLVSVVNTTYVGKVVKVRFREAYNGRAVLDFNLYLSPADVWTANVFALADAGIDSEFAALFTDDHSCTDPPLNGSGTLPHGAGFRRFGNDRYTGAAADTGPASDARTREGHIEMILMSDVLPGSPLSKDIAHTNGVPPDCTPSTLETAAGYAAPTLDPANGAPDTRADGGLFGSASIVDVADGVFYAYNADALDGFSYRSLYSVPGDAQPTLASVNDRADAQHATAHLFIGDQALGGVFPGSDAGSRVVDAVSAVFSANSVYNEYAIANDGSAATDWVLTFPTKNLYVDAQPGGAIAGSTAAFAPFDALFGVAQAGISCLGTDVRSIRLFDREENTFVYECGFSSCPPLPVLCQQTNVVRFPGGDDALRSQLPQQFEPFVRSANAGWIRWAFPGPLRQLAPAGNGNVFHGVPLTGFAAIKFVNGAVSLSRGGSALANYSGAYHHRSTSECSNGGAPCQ
jgi:hypothetical protein